jgi:hypothetical protein
MVLAYDASRSVRLLQKIDITFLIVEAAVQAVAAAISHQRSKKGIVWFDADPFPSERGL